MIRWLLFNVDDHESNLDYYNKKAKQRHIQRVTNKTEKSVIVNSTYVDILSNLERIGDHCQNIAESYMLEEEKLQTRLWSWFCI